MHLSEKEKAKLINKEYWRSKLSSHVFAAIPANGNRIEIVRNCSSNQLNYFFKITAGNVSAEYSLMASIYLFLIERYFTDDFDGLLFSDHNFPPLRSALIIKSSKELKQHTLKSWLQQTAKEVQSSASHLAVEETNELSAYSSFGLTYTAEPNDGLANKKIFLQIVKSEEDNLELLFTFDENVFPKYVVEHFADTFKSILIDLEANINKELLAISLLSETEKKQVLEGFNATVDLPLSAKTLSGLFKKQATLTPENIALAYQTEEFSYAALDEKSNALAQYLKSNFPLQANDLVGVKLERTPQLIIAILAILKTGAAYVPIDLNYPVKRQKYIEEDSRCSFVVDEEFILKFENSSNGYSNELLSINDEKDTAYVIYTSGSTGQPKGVMISHENAVAMVHWAQQEFDASTFEVCFAATSHCFDLSIFEMFYTLSVGKKIRLLQNALEIENYLEEEQSILINTVPAVIRQLIEKGNWRHDNVTVLNLAGEVFPTDIVEDLALDKTQVRNLYGPSEDTTYSTCYQLKNSSYTNIPIGRPILNTQAYILDDNFNPLPIGVTGKLFLAGTGVAKGYLHQPELTQEKFLSNPFIENGQMYATGDLAKWMPDGNIIFLGRKDQQVKLHGYRIELSEIEQCLLEYTEHITQVIAAVKEVNQRPALVAYYLSSEKIAGEELREYLKKRLPAFMVPNYFMAIDAAPLSPNGKIDRSALPNVQLDELTDKKYTAPVTKIERELVNIWQAILGISRIGIHDDFFALGGHSLLIAQIINEAHLQLEKRISYKEFYANSTIAGLSKVLKNRSYVAIGPAPLEDDYPVTTAQERLWLLSQLEGGNQAYQINGAVRIKGRLQLENFKNAWQQTEQRYEILRTAFRTNQQGILRQYVSVDIDDTFTFIDWSKKNFNDQEIANYLQAHFLENYALDKNVLHRGVLIRLQEEEHIFYLNLHHIIADGWSLEVLTAEVLKAYEQFASGENQSILTPKIQFKDIVVWQGEQNQGEEWEAARKYWLGQFAKLPPVLQLPIAKSRPAIKTYRGASQRFCFSPIETQGLRRFAARQQATVFMCLMAGIRALLARYSQQEDIVIGIPSAGRDHPDLENQIGLFLNTLPIRQAIQQQDSFLEILAGEKQALIDAHSHQQYAFDQLIQELKINRDPSRSPLFDVMVAFQSQNQIQSFKDAKANTSLEINQFPMDRTTAQFDLNFDFKEEKTLELIVTYNLDNFSKSHIEKFIQHFHKLLLEAVENPEIPVGELEIISIAEKNELLDKGQGLIQPLSSATALDLFNNSVEKYSSAKAIHFEGNELSYQELDKRANSLANFLIHQYAVATEDRVVVKLERSEWLITALLAVMKAGAVYVPVDPNYPDSRQQYIINDSAAKVIIDKQFIQAFLNNSKNENESINVDLKPNNLAYVIYTSGSTGQPKGVMIEHRSLVNFIDFYQLEQHRSSLTTNFIFDVSVLEIFTALFSGSTLYIPKMETAISPEAYADFLFTNKISHAYLHPMQLERIAERLSEHPKVFLKRIIIGVEGIKKEAVKWFLDQGVRIINAYGPTETTICATYCEIKSISEIGTANLPIGIPLPNYSIVLLQPQSNKLQPLGLFGEVCIAGAGVARGYLKRAKLNAEKFVEHPFQLKQLMYRTGDLARWLPDGNLEFLGRLDFQIKIRGNRVEPGEIEQVIQSAEQSITQVVVTVKDFNQEDILVAYFVATGTVDKMKLRKSLQEKLPYYMVPGLFKQLSDMPITANRKIDRQNLPEIFLEEVIRHKYRAPENHWEEKVIAIWEELLKQKDIGADDNFFELGGHSLLLTQLINAYQLTFNVAPELKALYADTCLASHAALIAEAVPQDFLPIVKIAEAEDYELSPTQSRFWLLQKLEPQTRRFNIFSTFDLPADLNISVFNQAFNLLLQQQESLRTFFIEKNDLPRQKIEKVNAFVIAELDNGQTAKQQIFEHSFDLSQFPLFKVALVKSSTGQQLFFNIHHIISDGWSMEFITRKLLEIYQSLLNNEQSLVKPLNIQYKDYSHWQNQMKTTDQYSDQQLYWQNQLAGNLPYLQLPRDNAQARFGDQKTAASYKVFIKKEIQEKINQFTKRNGISNFSFFVSVFKIVLQRITSLNDVILGIPVANRNHHQLRDVVGCFLNTLMLRSLVDKQQTALEFTKQIHQTVLDALGHQNYPFESVLQDLNIPRQEKQFPISPVFLNMLDFTAGIPEPITNFKAIHSSYEAPPKFELECYIKTYTNGLAIDTVYDPALFKAETIVYWLEAFTDVIDQLIDQPTRNVADFDLFTKPLSAAPYPKPTNSFETFTASEIEQSVAKRFEKQVAKTPAAIAAVDKNGGISYDKLNQNANRLARELIANDLPATARVALLLPHNVSCLLGMLAVLKAGKAYVPIDADSPQARMAHIMQDAQCSVLLCNEQTERKAKMILADNPQLKIIKINIEAIKAEIPNPTIAIDPQQEAYVLYTSGSTGLPKGVVQNQKNMLHYIRVYTNQIHIATQDKLSVFSTYTFDAAIKDIYGAVLNGASVYFYQLASDGLDNLKNWINKKGITIMHMVPTVYRYFINILASQDNLTTVRILDLGGEACLLGDFEKFKTHFSEQTILVNDYGPTEATIISQRFLNRENLWSQAKISLGKPVLETEMFLLDENDQPVGIYQEGELVFKSEYLSLGYLHREELNKKVFTSDPRSGTGRIYRSGDIGRLLPTGEIEFVKRKDSQIKLNGLRIELEEIEKQLEQIPEIHEAVVILQIVNDQEQLCAYLRSELELKKNKINKFLQAHLPSYMIPGIYTYLERFPITRTGKIARKELPKPASDELALNEYVAPTTETEKAVLALWLDLLSDKVERIGIHDDFFAVGGNSLQALVLLNRINKRFDTQLSIEDLFNRSNIKELAELMDFSVRQQSPINLINQDHDEVVI